MFCEPGIFLLQKKSFERFLSQRMCVSCSEPLAVIDCIYNRSPVELKLRKLQLAQAPTPAQDAQGHEPTVEPITEAATEGRRSSEEFAEGQHHFEAPFVLLRHLALTSGSSPSQTQLSMIFEELYYSE